MSLKETVYLVSVLFFFVSAILVVVCLIDLARVYLGLYESNDVSRKITVLGLSVVALVTFGLMVCYGYRNKWYD